MQTLISGSLCPSSPCPSPPHPTPNLPPNMALSIKQGDCCWLHLTMHCCSYCHQHNPFSGLPHCKPPTWLDKTPFWSGQPSWLTCKTQLGVMDIGYIFPISFQFYLQVENSIWSLSNFLFRVYLDFPWYYLLSITPFRRWSYLLQLKPLVFPDYALFSNHNCGYCQYSSQIEAYSYRLSVRFQLEWLILSCGKAYMITMKTVAAR